MIIENNLVIGNTAAHGGGLFISENDSTIIRNNTIVSNIGYNDGGGICIWVENNGITAENNIIVGNVEYAVVVHEQSTAEFDCNDAFANIPEDYPIGILVGPNSISSDPRFCDTLDDNYYLWYSSPCHPDSSECGLIGAFDIGCVPPPLIDDIWFEEDAYHIVNHQPDIYWLAVDTSGFEIEMSQIEVGTDNDWTYAEMWNPAPFPGPDSSVTYAGAALVDGETYYPRLRVRNGLAWSDWYEMSFRMNSVPSVPVLLSPIGDIIESEVHPMLYLQNSTDAEGDLLSYE